MELRTNAEFRGIQEKLGLSISLVFQTGYRWLLEHVRSSLDSFLTETSEGLYSHLRTVFNDKTSKNIWLYAIVDHQGIYIPDTIQREVALARASKRKLITSQSPLELVAKLGTTPLDLDTIFSRTAIKEGHAIERTFEVVPYGESGLQIAEQAVFATKEYVIQPLVREGKILLTAGYPTDLRTTVEHVLEREKEMLKKLIAERASLFRKMIRQIKQTTLPSEAVNKYLGYAGNLLGGILEHFIKSQ